MNYHHTQRAPIHWILHFFAAYFIWFAWVLRDRTVLLAIMSCGGAAFVFLAFAFRHLTVSDDGDALGVRFGPLPVFGTRIPYNTITAVEGGRSSLIDGWGIHYVPGRGWIYNVWGFDCVCVHYDNRLLRIGSDDSANLVMFLRGKISNMSACE